MDNACLKPFACTEGNPSSYSVPFDGTSHVVYRSQDGHIHELLWTKGAVTHNDLTGLVDAPNAVGDPAAYCFQMKAHTMSSTKALMDICTSSAGVIDGSPTESVETGWAAPIQFADSQFLQISQEPEDDLQRNKSRQLVTIVVNIGSSRHRTFQRVSSWADERSWGCIFAETPLSAVARCDWNSESGKVRIFTCISVAQSEMT